MASKKDDNDGCYGCMVVIGLWLAYLAVRWAWLNLSHPVWLQNLEKAFNRAMAICGVTVLGTILLVYLVFGLRWGYQRITAPPPKKYPVRCLLTLLKCKPGTTGEMELQALDAQADHLPLYMLVSVHGSKVRFACAAKPQLPPGDSIENLREFFRFSGVHDRSTFTCHGNQIDLFYRVDPPLNPNQPATSPHGYEGMIPAVPRGSQVRIILVKRQPPAARLEMVVFCGDNDSVDETRELYLTIHQVPGVIPPPEDDYYY